VGTASGVFPDIAWTDGSGWDVLLRSNAFEQLTAAGVRGLRVVAPALITPADDLFDVMEIDIPLAGQLHDYSFAHGTPRYIAECGAEIEMYDDDAVVTARNKCPACDRVAGSIRRCVLERASIPANIDIFRPTNATTYVIVTEQFANAVTRLGLAGAVLDSDVSVAA
jgi:hypothetical protein